MRCPKCSGKLKRVEVSVEGVLLKTLSYQCPTDEYVKFDPINTLKTVKELRKASINNSNKAKSINKKH